MQGYTGCEFKKEMSKVGEDGNGNREEEEKDMRGIFFEVKQENLHELGGCHVDNVAWCRCSMRWRGGCNKIRGQRNRWEKSKPGTSRGVLMKRLLVLGYQVWIGQPVSRQKWEWVWAWSKSSLLWHRKLIWWTVRPSFQGM